MKLIYHPSEFIIRNLLRKLQEKHYTSNLLTCTVHYHFEICLRNVLIQVITKRNKVLRNANHYQLWKHSITHYNQNEPLLHYLHVNVTITYTHELMDMCLLTIRLQKQMKNTLQTALEYAYLISYNTITCLPAAHKSTTVVYTSADVRFNNRHDHVISTFCMCSFNGNNKHKPTMPFMFIQHKQSITKYYN